MVRIGRARALFVSGFLLDRNVRCGVSSTNQESTLYHFQLVSSKIEKLRAKGVLSDMAPGPLAFWDAFKAKFYVGGVVVRLSETDKEELWKVKHPNGKFERKFFERYVFYQIRHIAVHVLSKNEVPKIDASHVSTIEKMVQSATPSKDPTKDLYQAALTNNANDALQVALAFEKEMAYQRVMIALLCIDDPLLCYASIQYFNLRIKETRFHQKNPFVLAGKVTPTQVAPAQEEVTKQLATIQIGPQGSSTFKPSIGGSFSAFKSVVSS